MMTEVRVMLSPWGVSTDKRRLEETSCRAGHVLYLHLAGGLQITEVYTYVSTYWAAHLILLLACFLAIKKEK